MMQKNLKGGGGYNMTEENSLRYASHNKLFNQEELMKKKVAVIGSGPLAHYVLSAFCGLGIGRILIFEDEKDSKEGFLFFGRKPSNNSEALEQIISRVNSDITVRRPIGGLDTLVQKPDLIIDATNNPESKAVALKFAIDNKLPFISASSSSFSSELAVYNPHLTKITSQSEADIFFMKKYSSSSQGGATSGVIAGMIAEESRKFCIPSPSDNFNIQLPIYYNLLNNTRFGHENQEILPSLYEKKKILMIGAGSIGTFAGIGIAESAGKRGNSLTIIDFDDIEPHNLNRQVLYFDKVGKRKAEAFRESLSQINPHLNVIAKYAKFGLEPTKDERKRGISFFSEDDLSKSGHDLIIGCVDNDETRKVINELAVKYKIPYIDGSSGLNVENNLKQYYTKSWINIYAPQKTPCMHCQRSGLLGRAGQGCEIHPDLIMPNMVAGSIEAAEAAMILSGSKVCNGFFVYISKEKERVGLVEFINKKCPLGCN